MSIFYHSTRSSNELVTSKKAILEGIASDGGLFIADGLANHPIDLATVCTQDFQANARLVLAALLDDFTPEQIAECVEAAYNTNFASAQITPVTPMGSDYLLELFHGPTCAFKDIALQMLPQLMSCAREGDGRNVMIVTATSGDTGKAALAGFAGVAGTGITVFYPAGKVSDIQRLQMVTQGGANVEVCAVEGNFDDVQTQVKRIFANRDLASSLAAKKSVLSSANSINIGRLVPQVVYYFDAYAQLVRSGAITLGTEVEFCVPTGNFGDVLAGYIAKLLGLPVKTLVVASNKNDVLTDFISTGTYNRIRPFHKTISPSMDILVSSNLERLLYLVSDGDVELVSHLMSDLDTKGSYTIPSEMLTRIQNTFACGHATDEQTRRAIRDAWEQDHVLLDTHTAVARYVESCRPRSATPRIILATANPYKFSADVLSALGADTTDLDGFACMDKLATLTGTTPPAQLSNLRSAQILHPNTCSVAQMQDVVVSACERIFS